jgi:hypothetical protein
MRVFILRLACLNGATMEDMISQVHVGRELPDNIEFSERTYRLDTNAQRSALRDVISNTFASRQVDKRLAGIRLANERGVEWRSIQSRLQKRLLKGELEEAKKAFESEDVVNLPPVHTVWRASNALSWIARSARDPERKLELERVAGEILTAA